MFDVIIIGGGPAGTTAAILLAKAGWSVALIEKDVFPRRKVCGEFISATTFPLLHELGIANYYNENAGPEIRRAGLFGGNKMLHSAMPLALNATNPWGRALGREHLDTALMNRAKALGVEVWQPWTAIKITKESSYSICQLKAKEKTAEISARMLISAQGSWVKNLVHLNTLPHHHTDFLGFKAHFHYSTLDADLMPLIAFPGGYGGLVNTDDGRVSLSCCIRRDTLQQIRGQYQELSAGEAVLKHIKSHCLGVRSVLSSASRQAEWLSIGPIRPGFRTCYESGVFFVGNIAGEAHPIVAEGISMAMQSAWICATILKAQPNLDLAGREYALKWKKQFSTRIRASSLYAQLAIQPKFILLLAPLFSKFPKMITYGAKLSGKTMVL